MLDNIFSAPTPNFKNSLFSSSPRFTEPSPQHEPEESHDNSRTYRLVQRRDYKVILTFVALMLPVCGVLEEPHYEFGIFLISTVLILVHISLHMCEDKIWYGGFCVIVLSLFPVFIGTYITISVNLKYAIFITYHSSFHHFVSLMIGKRKLHVFVSFSTVCMLSFSPLFLNFSLDWTLQRIVLTSAWFLLFPVVLSSVFDSGNDVKLCLVRKKK
jgi:hypothetical protein